jgi:hypothetical protein
MAPAGSNLVFWLAGYVTRRPHGILTMAAGPHFREKRPFFRLGQPDLPVGRFKICQLPA